MTLSDLMADRKRVIGAALILLGLVVIAFLLLRNH